MNFIVSAIDSINLHKGRILNFVFAIASISLAHYAGFISELPLQIVAAAGGTMASGVTATFLFYVALCAVLARVTVGILQLFLLPQLFFTDRAGHGFKLQGIGNIRKYVRSYNRLLHNEGYIWLSLQVIIFLICLLGLYIDFNLSWKSVLVISLALLVITLSGAFRTRFLLFLHWKPFIKRIRQRNSFRLNVASAAFVTIASALVITSFFIGQMRMTLLKTENSQQIINPYFVGYAKLLASSGSSTLLFEEDKGNERYIYTTREYALASESIIKSFPMLQHLK